MREILLLLFLIESRDFFAISFAVPLGLRPCLTLSHTCYILSLLTLLFFPFPSSRASEPASLPPPPPSPSLFRVTHLLYPYPSPSLGLSLATHKPLPPDCRRSRLPRPPPRVLPSPRPFPRPPSPPRTRSPLPPVPSSPRAFLLFLFRLFLSLVKSISHSACSLHWQRGTLPDFLCPIGFFFFFFSSSFFFPSFLSLPSPLLPANVISPRKGKGMDKERKAFFVDDIDNYSVSNVKRRMCFSRFIPLLREVIKCGGGSKRKKKRKERRAQRGIGRRGEMEREKRGKE